MTEPADVEPVWICDDLKWALDHARARKALARQRGWNEATAIQRTRGQAMRQEVVGIIGELVFARHLGLEDFVPGNGTLRTVGDVQGWEVKATDGEFKRILWRDSQDMPERRYALVNVELNDCKAWVRGWILGSDALQYPLERPPGTAGKLCRIVPWAGMRSFA